MSEDNKHWTSQVKVFKAVYIDEVEKTLNEFYKDRFIIATQIFPLQIGEGRAFDLVVYFKVPPEDKAGK
jgi:hypothetical protein